MSLSTILPGVSGTRTSELLSGSDVAQCSPSTSTSQLADLGGITTTVEDLLDGVAGNPSPTGNGTVGAIAQPVVDAANEAVLDIHAVLEQAGHQIPALNQPLHAVINLGETIGLGKIGTEQNLVSDVLDAPSHVLAGDVHGAVQPILQDVADVAGAAGGLAESLTQVAGSGSGIVGPGGLLTPVTQVADTAVGTIQSLLESVGHDVPLLNGPLDGLTHLGGTIGLGHLGDAAGNLIVDTIQLPGAILGGQDLGTALQPVLGDVGDTLHATTGLVHEVLGSVGSAEGGGLGGTLGSVLGGADCGPLGGLLPSLGGLTGNGSEPLIDVGAFGQTANPLAVLDILAPTRTEAPHAIDVAVLQSPAGQNSLVDLQIADGHTIDVPSLGGAGLDCLVGCLADTAPLSGSPGHEGTSTGVALPVVAELLDGLSLGFGHHDAQQHGLTHALI